MDLKDKVASILSEILSDKHECRVVLRFEKKVTDCEETSKTHTGAAKIYPDEAA